MKLLFLNSLSFFIGSYESVSLSAEKKTLEAILFDCDGVLAETERDGHRQSFNRAFEMKVCNIYVFN